MRNRCCIILLLVLCSTFLFAQSHVSVPVDDSVYYILEAAQLRGLCNPLPKVKPYSRAVVLSAIQEILGSGGRLGDTERQILENAGKKYGNAGSGLDWQRGSWRFDTQIKNTGIKFAGDIGVGLESLSGAGINLSGGDSDWGTDSWISAISNGDIGEHFSWGFTIAGGLLRAPRSELGKHWTYYSGFPTWDDREKKDSQPESYYNREVSVYSEPVPFFPYTFRKGWDGVLFGSGGISAGGHKAWPDGFGMGSSIISELDGVLFGDALSLRFGRLRHEWAGMSNGSSLVLNAAAQPFMAVEATFAPIPWFSFSALTGVLEYYNENGIKDSAWTSQNVFSIEQLEFNFKNYFHFDVGSTAVWPKRFELGYIFPINNNFMYQNNLGDFDNLGLFSNLQFQYPGIASLWLSLFIDEIEISSVKRMFELDRHMFAYQAGVKTAIPWLSFTQITLSYTKIEPYTYTHTRIYTPWNNPGTKGDLPMETSYLNNGVGIGYYLPPNSDELLLRFDTMPFTQTKLHFQYQMIRHGAEFGPHQVDGSSYLSELDPEDRSSKKVLEKDFLKDGAYQWMHIIKAGGDFRFSKLPLTIYGEAGVVFSYFKDVDDEAYKGESTISSDKYPESTGFIFTLGFRLFL
ncbi:MAG: hypothetical protein LBP76_01855 [Treponema sp.]|jgi:hypothetical protein|nr:hypothetical protein [Treponema sp.]